jgi:hypothetical protein
MQIQHIRKATINDISDISDLSNKLGYPSSESEIKDRLDVIKKQRVFDKIIDQ